MNLKNPHVAVIIPTHNREKFIGAAIESVLVQTYQDFEIIIIDDGSVDHTKDLIGSYPSDRITYIYLDQGGPGRARNEGIRKAKGEVIAFLDSDDLWSPNKLEQQLHMMSNDPQVSAVLSNFRFIDTNGLVLNESVIGNDYSYGGNFLKDYFDGRLPVYTSTLLIKRAVFEKIGYFDEKHVIAEDMDLWIKLAAHYKIAYIHQALTDIRKHPGNISGSSRAKTYYFATVMIERNYNHIRAAGLSPERYLARFFSLAGNEARREKNRHDAMKYFTKAIKADPGNMAAYSGILKTLMMTNR